MSVAATEEDLKLLADLVPLLAKKLTDAQQSAEALESAVTQFQHDVDEARQEAASRLTDMQDALPALAVQAEAEEKALKDAETALIGAWHEAEPRLAAAGEAALAPVADIISHTHDLQAALAEAGTRIDQSQAMGEAALAKLGQDCHAAEQRIQAALQALEKEAHQLEHSAQEAIAAVTSAATNFEAALTMANGHCDAALEKALQEMDDKTIAFKGAAPALYESLAGLLMEKVDGLDGEIQQAVTTPLTEAETELERDFDKLGVTTDIWGQELEQHTQKLEEAVEEVKQEAASVPAGITEINNAAAQLGF
jgi:archaellum component FlaC